MAEIVFTPDPKPLVKGSYGRNLRGTLYFYLHDPAFGDIAFEFRGCLVWRDKGSGELKFRLPMFKGPFGNKELIVTSQAVADAVVAAVLKSPYAPHIGVPEVLDTTKTPAIGVKDVTSVPLTLTGSGDSSEEKEAA